MTQKSVESKGRILEGLSSLIRGTGASKSEAPAAASEKANQFQSSARELSSAVESLKSRIEKQRQEAEAKSRSTASSVAAPIRTGPTRQELQKAQYEQALHGMRSTILALHSKLGSGFSENSLQELQGNLLDLTKESGDEELDARIRTAVIERVNRELGPVAWSVLMSLMESAKVQWPEPGGLLPGASEEERAKAVRFHMDEAESLFCSQSLKAAIENMQGVVSAWKVYPDETSWLWQEVAIRGVGSAIRCRLMFEAANKVRTDGAALRAKAAEIMSEHMTKIQEILTAGVHSVDDAEKVVQGSDIVVRELIPDLAWQHVREVVDQCAARFVKGQ